MRPRPGLPTRCPGLVVYDAPTYHHDETPAFNTDCGLLPS
ncbi:hypothetical protein HMPREF1980_01807 [Actinomyces sp. oral taxon 172 str. F0311]|nr:hypothetical protein HMPREF1980_01807 [Actinomyces sp. oral taxon 172 str. F0311]